MTLAAVVLAATLAAPARYHIDFTRIFPSPEAERAGRAAIARDIEALESMRGHVTDDAQQLLLALQRNDALQMTVARHAMYLYLRYAVDTRDTKSRDESDLLPGDAAAKTAFLRDEIGRLTDDRLAELIKGEPKLETYRHAIDSIRRNIPHMLPEADEKLLAAVEPAARQWQFDLYEQLKTRVPAAERASERDLFAFTLMRLASAGNTFAKIRKFHDAVEESYFDRELTRPEVQSLLDQLASNASVYKEYQRLRSEHAAPAGFAPPHFTIEDARRILTEVTSPLGPEYSRELNALLDPANGRMDIEPGPDRKSGGFSEGAIGTDSVFFSHGFSGSYNDMRVLMHESTHAVQRQLMTAAHVSVANAEGPHYLPETLAMFNELALADWMARHARTDPEREFYLEQFLDGKGMIAFVVAPEAEFEQSVYDGVASETIRGADDLDALTTRMYSRFSISPDKDTWMSVQLMYEDPFYDLNYVVGGIVALRLYAMFTNDPARFAPRYVAMMSNGYDARASELLDRFFAIDLNDPKLVTGSVQLLRVRVDQLRASFMHSSQP